MKPQPMFYYSVYNGKKSPTYVVIENETWHSDNKVRELVKEITGEMWRNFVLQNDNPTREELITHALQVSTKVQDAVETMRPTTQ